jgi:hypothetical protein
VQDAIVRIYKAPPKVWNKLPRKRSLFNNLLWLTAKKRRSRNYKDRDLFLKKWRYYKFTSKKGFKRLRTVLKNPILKRLRKRRYAWLKVGFKRNLARVLFPSYPVNNRLFQFSTKTKLIRGTFSYYKKKQSFHNTLKKKQRFFFKVKKNYRRSILSNSFFTFNSKLFFTFYYSQNRFKHIYSLKKSKTKVFNKKKRLKWKKKLFLSTKKNWNNYGLNRFKSNLYISPWTLSFIFSKPFNFVKFFYGKVITLKVLKFFMTKFW